VYRTLYEHQGGAVNRKLLTGSVVLATGLMCSAPATAGVRQDFSARFTTARPASSTGLSFQFLYRDPADPNAKPPALTTLVVRLPVGTTFDAGAAPVCSATDAQLELEGPSACPSASQVGSGTFTAMTGIPPLDPFVATDLIYNGGDALIEDVVFKGTQVTAGIDRLTIRGSTLTAHPPDTPGGPPDGRTVPRQIDFAIAVHGRFVRTPASCPRAGWVASSTATFADGASETDTSELACRSARRSRSTRSHRDHPGVRRRRAT
jgi:hypothetical protein